jgi:hypothetical protein
LNVWDYRVASISNPLTKKEVKFPQFVTEGFESFIVPSADWNLTGVATRYLFHLFKEREELDDVWVSGHGNRCVIKRD